MSASDTVVIVGAGLAGAKAAESLRGWRFDGRVVLIGAEQEAPYERPPLSKAYLRGRADADATRVHDATYYWKNGIDLRTGTRVTSLDPRRQIVTLEPGRQMHYDRLLLATGTAPRTLTVPGADLAGVFTLRTLADADAIRRSARRPGAHALVVGGGWIGGEVAASLSRSGVAVTMLVRGTVPFQRTLGPQIGSVFANVHRERGVDVRTGTAVAAFLGGAQLTGARLSDGTALGCDLAIVAIGADASTELASSAGIATADGIAVDRFLRTDATNVFAAGDVATVEHPLFGTRIRTGHSWSALTQGPVAAANMLGHRVAYDWVPYFSSRQHDFEIEYTGHADGADHVVFRGDPASRRFIAFWLDDGRLRAALNAGIWGVAPIARKLIRSGRTLDPDLLADPDFPLRALVSPDSAGAMATFSSAERTPS